MWQIGNHEGVKGIAVIFIVDNSADLEITKRNALKELQAFCTLHITDNELLLFNFLHAMTAMWLHDCFSLHSIIVCKNGYAIPCLAHRWRTMEPKTLPSAICSWHYREIASWPALSNIVSHTLTLSSCRLSSSDVTVMPCQLCSSLNFNLFDWYYQSTFTCAITAM